MNAPFDTLALADALGATSLGKTGGETAARAIAEIAMRDIATKADLEAAKHALTVRVGAIMLAASTIIVAVLGALISIQ